jgi:hypothetical protein
MRDRSRVALVLACVAVAGGVIGGCKPKPKPGDATPGHGPTGTTAHAPKDDFKPAHPGHVDQRDATGSFVAARPPPPVAAAAAIQGATFDKAPAAVKVAVPKAGNGHCGEIDIGGGKKIYLDCMSDDYAKVKSAATPLVSHDELTGGAAPRKLPPLVDHRKNGTEGPVLDQGQTLACTSFSLVAAVNHSISRYLGHPGNLSPMHSWARYHTPKMTIADEVNVGHGLVDLTALPFDEKLANAWQQGKSPVDPSILAKADAKSSVKITNITHVPTVGDIKSALAAGQDVWFALRAAHTLSKTAKNPHGAAIVPDFDYKTMPASDQMGHAILLSGYQDSPHGTYYLIHNSWGPSWGEGGYAWIHEATLARNISDAYVVEAHPAEPTDAKVPPPVHKFMSCADGTAPDGITSQCVPRCPDKGPRANGVCPVAGACPAGDVNLHGSCQPAAPVIDKTLASGLKVTCGESGCTYIVPNGKNDCTSATGCAVSCPSPRFRLAHGPRGLVCTG